MTWTWTSDNYQDHEAVQAMLDDVKGNCPEKMRGALVVQSTALYGKVPEQENMRVILKRAYVTNETQSRKIKDFINKTAFFAFSSVHLTAGVGELPHDTFGH